MNELENKTAVNGLSGYLSKELCDGVRVLINQDIVSGCFFIDVSMRAKLDPTELRGGLDINIALARAVQDQILNKIEKGGLVQAVKNEKQAIIIRREEENKVLTAKVNKYEPYYHHAMVLKEIQHGG